MHDETDRNRLWQVDVGFEQMLKGKKIGDLVGSKGGEKFENNRAS